MKIKISKLQANQILESCNPLGVQDENGRMRIFKSADACYEYVINRVFHIAPRGWCDIPFILHKMQCISVADAVLNCKRFKYAVVNWDANGGNKEDKSKDRLKSVIYCFLRHTGCEFNENAFNAAWFAHTRMMEEYSYYDSDFKVKHVNIKFN